MSKAKAFPYRPPAPLYAKTAEHRPMVCNAPVTENVTPRAAPVTKSVTSKPAAPDPVTKRVTLLEARVAQLEAQIAAMLPKSAAERKRASRERKKAQRTDG